MPQIKHVGEIHGASFHLSLNSGLTRQSVCLETVHVHVLEPCCYSNSYKSLSAMFIYHGWQMLMYNRWGGGEVVRLQLVTTNI